MNKKKISAAEAKAIWKRTRRSGEGEAKSYAKAARSYQGTPDACAQVGSPRSLASGPTTTACLARADAATRAATAAHGLMSDWGAHLASMDARDRGDVSPGRAHERWLALWRKAPKNLDAFAEADRALRDAPSCLLVPEQK